MRHGAEGSPGSSVTRLAPSWTGERPAPGALASAADMPPTAGRLGGYPAEEGVAGGSVGIPDLGRIMTSPIEMVCPTFDLRDVVVHTAVNHIGLQKPDRRGAWRGRLSRRLSCRHLLAACRLARFRAPAGYEPSFENRFRSVGPDTGRSAGQGGRTKVGGRREREDPSFPCHLRTHSEVWDTETAQLTLH